MTIINLNTLAPNYLPTLISCLQYSMMPIIHTPYAPATLCSFSPFSNTTTLSNFWILRSCSFLLTGIFYSPFHTRCLLLSSSHSGFFLPTCWVHSTSGSWTSCSLYLQIFCLRSLKTGYFSSFRSQLKHHLHKEDFSYHPIQSICPPSLTLFSLIFNLFNCLLNIYHLLTLLALKIIISIFPKANKPLTSRDFCLFCYTMSLAIGIVPAQSWSSINICWMNILILKTQPKYHILL